MRYYPLQKSIVLLLTVLSTVGFTSSQSFAQANPSLEASPSAPEISSNIISGIYSRGVQQLQIAQNDDNICIHGLLDSEVQAQLAEAIEKIRQEAAAAEAEIQPKLQQELNSRREQIQLLLQDESQLSAAIETGKLDEKQIQQIRQFQDNPQALETFLDAQVNEARQQLQVRIEEQRLEAEETIRIAAGNMVIQGVASLELSYPDIKAYTVRDTSFIVFSQEGERLVLGEPNKLQEFYLDEEVSLPESLSLQQCLDSQQPYSQLTMP